MKVMQFIHGLSMGGAETLVKDYVSLLPESIEGIVVTTDLPTQCENERLVRAAGIRIISIPERLGIKSCQNIIIRCFRKITKSHRYSRELRKIINEECPDCIHIHIRLLKYLDLIADDLQGISLFYTCHSIPKAMFSGKEGKCAKRLIAKCNMRLIALHDEMAKELDEMFCINNTMVIKNGVDYARFKEHIKSREEMRNMLDIPETAFVVGHVGRFSRAKNHIFLIDIFAELVKRRSDAFLLMVGSGELQHAILEKLDSYSLQGKYLILKNRSDIPDLMHSMDVFVFPSLYEGLPLTLIEAQISGLKCVISDKIAKDVLLTKHIHPLSLNADISEWCDIILNDAIINTNINGNLDDWDMKKIIRHIEKLYRGEE